MSEFGESFSQFLRMTGQTHGTARVKCDLRLQCCKSKYLEKQVKQMVTKSATFADVLVALERQYPSYGTNLSNRTEIQNLAMLPSNPKAARISELLADLDDWVGRLIPGSYGSDELFSGWWPRSHEMCGVSVGLRQSVRQETSPRGTCIYFFWSWHWR